MTRAAAEPPDSESGVGLIGSTIGAILLLFMLLASLHALLALQTRTLVQAAAWDAARSLATDPTPTQAEAERRVNSIIPKLHARVEAMQLSGDTIEVRVSAQSPGILPGVTSLDSIRMVQRTARVRRERELATVHP